MTQNNSKTLNFRKAQEGDFDKIALLQNQNLFSVLEESELKDGFLSTAFTPNHFRKMNESIGIAVAFDDEKLCGYLCCSTLEFNQQFSFPAAAIKNSEQILFKGRPLNFYNCFMGNPLCIDKDYRGEGLIVSLCDAAIKFIPSHFDLSLSFISKKNQRSINAAKKVGLQIIGEFSADENDFVIAIREMN